MDEFAVATIEHQCEQLLRRALQLMDAADWPAYIECFTADAVLARPSDAANPVVGRDAILASLLARPTRISCHLLANSVFDVIDRDRVDASSRVLLLSGDPSDQRPAPAHAEILAGSFDDQMRRIDGAWKIARRRGGIELAFGIPGQA